VAPKSLHRTIARDGSAQARSKHAAAQAHILNATDELPRAGGHRNEAAGLDAIAGLSMVLQWQIVPPKPVRYKHSVSEKW